MSLNAAMIQAMVDKGLSGQDIADIAKAGEAKVDRTAAERQARHRAKTRVARNGVTSRRDPLLEEEIITPAQSSPSGEDCLPAKRKSSPLTYLPDDWVPILTPAAERLIERWEPGRLERAINAFRDHSSDKGRKSRDWQAAFRKWLENDEKWNPTNGRLPANQNDSRGVRGSRPDPALDMLYQAQRELAAEAEREDPRFGQQAWPALPAH